jgi:hypothetical protein
LKKWVVVETTPQGFNDDVYITAMAQTVLLNINESPFFGNFGIPAHESIMQQFMPDFYLVQIQQFYLPFFSSLLVARVPDPTVSRDENVPAPVYRFSVITKLGFKYPPITVRGAPT